MQTVTRADFVLSEADTPPANASATAVTLPDKWGTTRPAATGSGWYLFDWTPPLNRAPIGALYLTGTTMPVEVYVNGYLIGATGALAGSRPGSWQRSQLFIIPENMIVEGANHIALKVREKIPGAGALGPVLVGPEPLLRDRAVRDLLLHTLGPAVVSVTIIALGVFILVLWLRRRDATYGLFGLAAVLWGLHTALSLIPTPLLPQPHWGIGWTTLYMLFVALLCLFCLRFAQVQWRAFRRFIIAFVVATPVILYLAAAAGVVVAAATVLRLMAIVITLIALVAVARYALRQRNTESMLLLMAGATAAAFGIHDWLVNERGTDLRPLMLVPYAGLMFLLLVGWILTDRFVRALNELETLNVDLEQRVVEKSEALQQQLVQTRTARDAAETANRGKTRFLAAASHDLRQPLHALGLFAARLTDRIRDPEDAALVQRIATAVASLDVLFSSLLDISKLEAGVVTAEQRAVSLDPLLMRMAQDFAPEALERGLKFAVVHTSRTVRSDPVLLERILRNLVANAMRYTTRGGVVIGVRPRSGRIAIDVWDSGPGIPPSELDRVFEEFYQSGSSGGDKTKGMGLGLTIVRRLSLLLGHEVKVASRVGHGSVFRVLLDEAIPDVAPSPESVSPQATDPLTGRRVLVIDDEEPVREATRQTLLDWGCIPVVAADADDAVSAMAGLPEPDILLVDFRLSRQQDGIDAIRRLRALLGVEVPAIIISGESTADELARIREAGFLLLHKPVSPAKLRASLSHLLAAAGRPPLQPPDSQ
ncbi:MAG: ATP-binding protein [Casimicrobiaceae bacterium]